MVKMLPINKLLGFSTCTSSCSILFRNTLFISIWGKVNLLAHAMDTSSSSNSNCVTGVNISSMSSPSTWVYTCATNSLFHIILPYLPVLFMYIHLVPIIFTQFGSGTSSHTSFLSNCYNSSCVASIQYSSAIASLIFFGSIVKVQHVMLIIPTISR